MRGEAEKTELAVTRARALRISAGAGPLSEGSLTVIAQPCAAPRRQVPDGSSRDPETWQSSPHEHIEKTVFSLLDRFV
jgi:hypothetical protein